jgi:hypothetical protein
MNLKEFAQYLQNKSFDEELHKVRRHSLERLLDNEPVIEKALQQHRPETPLKKTA